MNTPTSYCGLRCDTCPIHLVTMEPDAIRQRIGRISIAEQCTTIYGMTLLPEDVTDCDGCRATTGRLFSGCNLCEIRKCAGVKNIDSCAFCPDYPCKTLETHFSHDPDARIRLKEMRRGGEI